VASSDRLYTFGLGGNGQLGLGSKTNCLTPMPVPSISDAVAITTGRAVMLVSVYAGGDQCMALMAKVCWVFCNFALLIVFTLR